MALIQRAQDYFRSLDVRPLPEFVELSEFKVPQQADLSDRLQTNLQYYAANYFAVGALFLVIFCAIVPPFLFAVAIAAGGGGYLYGIRKGAPITIKNRTLTDDEIQYGYLTVSGIAIVSLGGYPLIYVLLVWIIVVVLHAVFRKVSLRSAGTTTLENKISSLKEDIKSSFRTKSS